MSCLYIDIIYLVAGGVSPPSPSPHSSCQGLLSGPTQSQCSGQTFFLLWPGCSLFPPQPFLCREEVAFEACCALTAVLLLSPSAGEEAQDSPGHGFSSGGYDIEGQSLARVLSVFWGVVFPAAEAALVAAAQAGCYSHVEQRVDADGQGHKAPCHLVAHVGP